MDIHYVELKAYVKAGAVEPGFKALEIVRPEGCEVSQEVLPPEFDGGVFNEEIHLLSLRITRQKDVKQFMSNLKEGLSREDFEYLNDSVSSRLDDEGNIYVRLSMSELGDGKYSLSTHECVHVRIKLAVYPLNLENALKKAYEVLE